MSCKHKRGICQLCEICPLCLSPGCTNLRHQRPDKILTDRKEALKVARIEVHTPREARQTAFQGSMDVDKLMDKQLPSDAEALHATLAPAPSAFEILIAKAGLVGVQLSVWTRENFRPLTLEDISVRGLCCVQEAITHLSDFVNKCAALFARGPEAATAPVNRPFRTKHDERDHELELTLVNAFFRSTDAIERRTLFAILAKPYNFRRSKVLKQIAKTVKQRISPNPDFVPIALGDVGDESDDEGDDNDGDGDDEDDDEPGAAQLNRALAWFSSRNKMRRAQADYDCVDAGKPLSECFAAARVKKETILAIMDAIISCSQGATNGKTRTAIVGPLSVLNMPIAMVTISKSAAFEELKKRGMPGGRTVFDVLWNALVKRQDEQGALSQQFVNALDAVNALYNMLESAAEIFARLKSAEAAQALDGEFTNAGVTFLRLKEMSRECENFIRFGIKVHLYKGCDTCDGNPLHCAAHACACPCSNAHDKHECTACANFSQLAYLAKALFNGTRAVLLQHGCLEVGSDDEKALDSMASSSLHISEVVFAYHAHMARGLWQNKAISLLESSITSTHGLISLDHKMKTIPRARDESSAAWFGKSGMVLLGFCALYRDDEGAIVVSYLDVVFESRVQDATQTSKGLECIIQLVHERLPAIKSVTFVSDNGPAISASENIQYVASRNIDKWDVDMFVAKWVYHEPGHGKTHLDSHFSFVTILFNRFVLDKGALSSPRDMFEALRDRGGIKNSSAALVDDSENVAGKVPKEPTPGVQKAREIVFGEDGSVSMRAFSARPGFLKTHKYTTKAPKKQFVVKEKFFGQHKARDERVDTKAPRSHEPAIVGDVSCASSLMRLIADCLLQYAHQSTLGAPLTTFSLSDAFAQANEVRTACRQRYLTTGWANDVRIRLLICRPAWWPSWRRCTMTATHRP